MPAYTNPLPSLILYPSVLYSFKHLSRCLLHADTVHALWRQGMTPDSAVTALTPAEEWTCTIYSIYSGKKAQDHMGAPSFAVRAHVWWLMILGLSQQLSPRLWRRRRDNLRLLPAVHSCLERGCWQYRFLPVSSHLGSKKRRWWSLDYPGDRSLPQFVYGRAQSLDVCGQEEVLASQACPGPSIASGRGAGCLGLLSQQSRLDHMMACTNRWIVFQPFLMCTLQIVERPWGVKG